MSGEIGGTSRVKRVGADALLQTDGSQTDRAMPAVEGGHGAAYSPPLPATNPPLPRFVLSVGVTGHRADRLTRALQASARRRVEEALEMVASLAAEIRAEGERWYSPEPNELRLISALAEGADTICAEVALSKAYLLDAPLPCPFQMASRMSDEARIAPPASE